jgi:hypothetical protein
MANEQATLYLDTWAGRIGYSVEIYGETPKRYRVMALENVTIAKRLRLFGDTFLVPKTAIQRKQEAINDKD